MTSGRQGSGEKDTNANGYHILVAEDSPTQAEHLRYILEEEHFQVTVANDGRKALDKVIELHPDMVISDIMMPYLDGYELCRHIKSDELTRHIPVILLTSLADITDVARGLECGTDSFITKPYSSEYLLKHVQKMLSNRVSQPDTGAGDREARRCKVELRLSGQDQMIMIDPQHMLNLLLSTYEAASQRNHELLRTQDELNQLNERLEELVEERTAALTSEITARERLQNELRELSLKDELSGLHNRRGFWTLAEQHWRLARSTGQQFVVFYADLDKLKYINDTYGHAQGDAALRRFSHAIEQIFRESDIIARVGGDEFCVLMIGADINVAQSVSRRFHTTLQRINIEEKNLYSLSASLGFAHYQPGSPISISDLIKQADADMYAQKQMKKRAGV